MKRKARKPERQLEDAVVKRLKVRLEKANLRVLSAHFYLVKALTNRDAIARLLAARRRKRG